MICGVIGVVIVELFLGMLAIILRQRWKIEGLKDYAAELQIALEQRQDVTGETEYYSRAIEQLQDKDEADWWKEEA